MAASTRWLFVARLRWTVDSVALAQYFSKFGRVQRAAVQIQHIYTNYAPWAKSMFVKQDVKSGRSKGYGFVTMADKASVSAILSKEAHSIEGRRAAVSVMKKDQQRGTQKGTQGGSRTGEEPDIEDMS